MDNAMDETRERREAADTAGAESPAAETVPPRTYERPLPPLPPPAHVPAADVRPPQVKAPVLAMLLSLFPGLGQLYNEQPAKALTFFFAFVGSIFGAAEISPLPFAFLIPFVWFYNLIDAWMTAKDINRRAVNGQYVRKDISLESPAWGAGLLLLGLVLLLNNVGLLRLATLARYWPMLLIVIGGLFLARALRARQAPRADEPFDERPL